MKINTFFNNLDNAKLENRISKLFIAGLIIVLIVLGIALVMQRTVVTIVPYSLTKEAWLSKDKGATEYKEAWGFALSELLGNLTPTSVPFIKKRLEPLLHPTIYKNVIDNLNVQEKEIIDNHVSASFEPRIIYYEKTSDKVFITGVAKMIGAAGEGKTFNKTYEFIIKVSNYAPMVTHIDNYKGSAKTLAVLSNKQTRDDT